MGKSVTVSAYLLEDIFRILDYLDMRGDYDELHFEKSGYSRRLENDNALRELRIKIKQLRGQIMETYLQTIDSIAEREMADLLRWVYSGRSVYENPFLIYNESGRPMDFINGCRAAFEMDEEPPDSYLGNPCDFVDDCRDDVLPF